MNGKLKSHHLSGSDGSDVTRIHQICSKIDPRSSAGPLGFMERATAAELLMLVMKTRVEELECKICYNRYDSRSRRPKLLACLHRVWLMEDDRHVLAVLSCHDQTGRTGLPPGTEVVLSPDSLTGVEGAERTGAAGEATSDCLVLTIMQLPGESSETLSMINMLYPNSLPCNVYFSSLPLGIYLLMIGQLWLGVVLVSLVPFTLLICILYGFCQCLCHELLESLGHHNTAP
ncbi:hypothetical protein CRUP_032248 [Coryphaenoides rupestris]|nr:hypothetical protein CRUP_032248 [Coryphaenoides rupestris]